MAVDFKDKVRALKENHIISAAQEIIAKNGGFLVSIADVAKAAGISKGGVLHYFPTKKRLFDAVFKDFFAQIFERYREEMAKVDNPIDQLKSFTSLLYNADDPDTHIGYPMFFECMQRAANDHAFRDVFSNWITSWVTILEAVIRDGISQGRIKKDIDPTEAAMAISAIYQGVASRWYLDRSRHSDQWAKKTVREAIDLLVGK
jgi:AcrR family transcriptional regulator